MEAVERGNPRDLLRAWRDKGKLSQDAAARALDSSQAMVSAIEQGLRTPGLPLAIKLRDVVGIPVESWRDSQSKDPQTRGRSGTTAASASDQNDANGNGAQHRRQRSATPKPMPAVKKRAG